ncbi:hypothetical protein [Phreatobacter stygius]|uniref:Uncharacterized protein n=1 Tax=Phreatobacter stygius TaxID=1940610 RepID=A0A4D7B650_9HYPH|nr:hypothetical protein [Phreatobacter stygius]QCI65848.1 hypothetical protein E8M01_17500 [Phreatobacter stygius]
MNRLDVGDLVTVRATGEIVAVQEIGPGRGSETKVFCRSILHLERAAELHFARDLAMRAAGHC